MDFKAQNTNIPSPRPPEQNTLNVDAERSRSIREMFGRIAPTYDRLNRTLSASIDQRWRKKAIRYIPPKEDLKVLDLCAGTLDLTLAILKKFPKAQITALDFSDKMLELGEKKIPADKKAQVEIKVGDAMDLQFPPDTFDAVICGFGMRNVVDNGLCLSQIHRILTPLGRVITLEFFRPETLRGKLFHSTFGKWVMPRIGSLLSKDPEAYDYLFNSIQSYYSVEEFVNLLINKNFHLIDRKNLTSHIASIVVGQKTMGE